MCALCLSALALGTGCPSTQNTREEKAQYVFPAQRPAGELAKAWFDGQRGQAAQLAQQLEQAPASMGVEERFVLGEYLYWQGDVEGAFEAYKVMLSLDRGHPLTRFAAYRLSTMYDEVLDFHDRLAPVLAQLKLREFHPLAAISLASLGQRLAWNQWRRSESAAPFSGDALGMPSRWMRSASQSPWRLLDFDQRFPPELERTMAPQHTSPAVAEPSAANLAKSMPYISAGTSLNPNLGASGVYYLETFATVQGDQPQVYWLYGSFPGRAKVFIDGQEVLDRPETDYATGRRLRRIKLQPGTHRVLVKLAYQQGYRDWFDLLFLNRDASPLEGSALSFHEQHDQPTLDAKGVELLSAQQLPDDLEWTSVKPSEVKRADSMTLYLTSLAAYENRHAAYFDPALGELERRHPKLAAALGLRAAQVQTLWEVPSRLRDATALKALRQALELDPDSLYFMIQVGDWLRKKGKDDEVRVLLERAKDAAQHQDTSGPKRVKNIMPLHTWAAWLQSQGWGQEAEQAWRDALEVVSLDERGQPIKTNCGAATKLQQLLAQRDDLVSPDAFGVPSEKCPGLNEFFVEQHPDMAAARLKHAALEASRYPYHVERQLKYAKQLTLSGEPKVAAKVLTEALARQPYSLSLLNELANRALAEQGQDAALKMLEGFEQDYGYSAWSMSRKAAISGKLPLRDLMQDGPTVAKRIAQLESQPQSGALAALTKEDEAYYAIDFAAAHYLPDGSAVTLTHTMVRVKTKGAIDRFGEVSIPSGAQVLVARTVKPDGSTLMPEQTAGKETLSMPGLTEGDFVELAYLEFAPHSSVANTHTIGTRFFFRMYDISSLHSEFVVINPPGDFASANNAPKAERFKYGGQPAVRFVVKDSPRPRAEPRIVNTEEFLPWVQLLHNGTTLSALELRQRAYKEALLDSLKLSDSAKAQLSRWRRDAQKLSGEEALKKLYYDVLAYFPNPTSGGLGTDISHALITREGSPLLVMHKLFLESGFKSDLYMVKSVYQPPTLPELADADKYAGPLLRVQRPGSQTAYWLSPTSSEAMFNSIPAGYKGQPALCITCESATTQLVPTQGLRESPTQVTLEAALSAEGELSGTMVERFDGATAAYVRSVLKQRKEPSARDKLIAALIGEYVPGATATSYKIEDEEALDKPLSFNIGFERPQFARKTAAGELVIESMLFADPLASAYAPLPQRETPLFINSERANNHSLTLSLPSNLSATMRSKAGRWVVEAPFGKLEREVRLDGQKLIVTSSTKVPMQRIEPAQYVKFQRWAVEVEQSGVLIVVLK